MLIDLSITSAPREALAQGAWAEQCGFAGVWTPETNHDPLLAAALVGSNTDRIGIGTAVAIAFARSPMTIAHSAWDLQEVSNGRFVLGLGPQVRAHIERRFSMPWSRPAQRMREYVQAVRAIWTSWQDGVPLDFRGDFYTHTLMTPYFTPEPMSHEVPKIYLAAVNREMIRTAAAVADGIHVHPLASERFLREVLCVEVERLLDEAGSRTKAFEIAVPVTVVSGEREEDVAAATKRARRQIAFYGSTPAYRSVLEVHGWGELQGELQALVRDGRWDDMDALIDEDVFDAFVVAGEPSTVAEVIQKRYGGIADRIVMLDVGTPRQILAEIAVAVADGQRRP